MFEDADVQGVNALDNGEADVESDEDQDKLESNPNLNQRVNQRIICSLPIISSENEERLGRL